MPATIVPQKIKDRLYPAVLSLFSKHDFHKVNIREISKLTGLSTSTVYKYYSSKEELLFTILDEHISEIGRLIEMQLAGMENTREIFRKLFWVTMDYYDHNPGVAVTSFITVPMRTWMKEKSFRREKEQQIMSNIMAKARERKDIDTSIDDRHITDLYYMFCHRHIHSWYYHGMKWKLADTLPDFFDYFWKIMNPASYTDNSQ